MEEQWKPIEIDSLQERYLVSNRGRIKSLPKLRNNGSGEYMTLEKVLKIQKHKEEGHNLIGLTLGVKSKKGKPLKKTYRVGRLVGIHFVDNPLNLPEVNHKDLDKGNDNDWNIEWVTESQNIQHCWDNDESRGSNAVEVILVNRKGKIIKEFKRLKDATKKYKTGRRTLCRWMVSFKPIKENRYVIYKKDLKKFKRALKEKKS